MLINAIVGHLVADWIFQNHWMAINKSSLLHPASWVHGFIHFVFLLLVFPVEIALAVSIIHILIDTRKPIQWWQKVYKQTTDGDYAVHIAIWFDQVLHITVLWIFVFILSR